MQGGRYLGLIAGPYRVALPIVAVRQILDAGAGGAPTDPRALGVEPIALASVLGARPTSSRQALLLFDGHPGPVLLTTDGLMGVLEPDEVSPLPLTVATRWPGLVRGTLRHDGLVLILDPQVLVGLVEVWDREAASASAEAEPSAPAGPESRSEQPLEGFSEPTAEPAPLELAPGAMADPFDQRPQIDGAGADPFDQQTPIDPFDQHTASRADPFDQASMLDEAVAASGPPGGDASSVPADGGAAGDPFDQGLLPTAPSRKPNATAAHRASEEPITGLTALEELLAPMMLPRRPSGERGRPGQGKNSQVLLFRAAGARFGVFIAEVGRLVVEHDVAPVPFAHPALAGLLDDASQQVVPVFDQMGLMGQPPRSRVEGARVALFETDVGPVGLRLDVMESGGLHYTFLSDKEASEARLAELPGELRAAVTAVGEDDGGPFFFFSADAFLAALDLGAPRRPT